jgi:Predicted hydrolases or acyltransferases (alpha/beta hydrolase superfamily)
MKLYYRELGQGQPIVMLHGIFGSSDNWLTQSRLLSTTYHTYALDLRNHGQSPHDVVFDYPAMVDDVVEFLETHQIHNPVIMGHSMGGKVAMNFAVAHPEKLQKLIVVDIAPKPYNMENYVVLNGLNSIPIDSITSRQEADTILARLVEELDVRQFVLKNLQRRPEGGFKWKLNLPAITENIARIGLPLEFEGKFEKPTLFVRGARSNYIKDHDFDRIRKIFPVAEFQTLDAGHWVPAEKPKEFAEVVEKWLA